MESVVVAGRVQVVPYALAHFAPAKLLKNPALRLLPARAALEGDERSTSSLQFLSQLHLLVKVL